MDLLLAVLMVILYMFYSGQWGVTKSCHIKSNDDFCAATMVPLLLQTGVLGTNCTDCLDRINVTRFAYGLAALGRELQVLKVTEEPKIEQHSPSADDLMDFY